MEELSFNGLSEEGYVKRSKMLEKVRKVALDIDKERQLAASTPPSYLLQRCRHGIETTERKLEELDDELDRQIRELRKQFEERRKRLELSLEENHKRQEEELMKVNKRLLALKIDFDNKKQEYEKYYGKCPIQLASNIIVRPNSFTPPPVPLPVPEAPKTFVEMKEKLPTIHFEGVNLPFYSHELKEEKSLEQLREEAKRIDREQQEKEEEYKQQQKEQRERERKAREEADRIRQDAQRKKELEEKEEEEDDASSTASWIKEAMKEDLECGLDEQKALELSRQKRSSFTSSLGTSSSFFYTTGTNTNAILGGVPSAPALPPPKPKKPVKTVPKRPTTANIGQVNAYQSPEED